MLWLPRNTTSHKILSSTEILLDYYSVRPSVCLSVSLSVRAAPGGRIGGKLYTGTVYGKSVKEFQIWLESRKCVGHFT